MGNKKSHASFGMGKWGLLFILIFLGHACFGINLGRGDKPGRLTLFSADNGQFIVTGAVQDIGHPSLKELPSPDSFIRLDPSLALVMCTRVKNSFLDILSFKKDQWRGRIKVNIQFTPLSNQPPIVVSRVYKDGWVGEIETADEVRAEKFVEAIVQSLILELAYRRPGNPYLEIPTWLTVGITQLVIDRTGPELLLEPNSFIMQRRVKTDTLATSKEWLRQNAAVSFEELSMPGQNSMTGAGAESYKHSAALFVLSLLELPDGSTRICRFIQELNKYYNWQTAFYLIYADFFQTPLDVEKWWTLVITSNSTRFRPGMEPVHLTFEKLEQVLKVQVKERISSNSIPTLSEIPLKNFVEMWDIDIQRPILEAKRVNLDTMRWSARNEVRPLIDEYLLAITEYLRGGLAIRTPITKTSIPQNSNIQVKKLVKKLELLDEQRFKLFNQLMRQDITQPEPVSTNQTANIN